MSVVNKGLTKKQALGMFKGMLETVDLSAVPDGMIYSARRDKLIMSKNALGIMNILRECAEHDKHG